MRPALQLHPARPQHKQREHGDIRRAEGRQRGGQRDALLPVECEYARCECRHGEGEGEPTQALVYGLPQPSARSRDGA